MSEIFLTQLAEGCVEGGGGFSYYRAGDFNGGAYRSVGQAKWDQLTEDMITPEFLKRFSDSVYRGG